MKSDDLPQMVQQARPAPFSVLMLVGHPDSPLGVCELEVC